MVLLTWADYALAQGSPGYRPRVPPGDSPGVRTGSSVRPPRLTGTQPTNRNPGGFRRQFFSPYQYLGSYQSAYANDSTNGYSGDSVPVRDVDPARYSTEVKPARNVATLDDSAAVGKLQVIEETDGSRKTVRLTWPDEGVGATQVAFFLADSSRAVLAAATVRSPPFTWRFEAQPRTKFVGMSAVLPGGSLVTQYVAYGREGRERREGREGRERRERR